MMTQGTMEEFEPTIMDKFREKFPNVPIEEDGFPEGCPDDYLEVDSDTMLCGISSSFNCLTCWWRKLREL